MKVIGTTDKGYIVDINNDEMANILGLYSHFNYSREDGIKAPRVGDSINIEALYKKTLAAETIKDKLGNLKELISKLTTIAEKIEAIEED